MTRPVPALLGLAVLAAAWAGPLPDLAATSFAAHMLLHMAVVAVAAPLIALGLRTRLGWAPAGPMVASLLDLVVIWAWHSPHLHDAARASGAALALEQASFLAVGLLLWLSALDRSRGTAGALAGAGALFFTSMHMTLLGVLLALAPLPLFHAGQVVAPPFGLSPAADRELGGILMLAIGGSVYLAGGLALVAGVLRLPRERDR